MRNRNFPWIYRSWKYFHPLLHNVYILRWRTNSSLWKGSLFKGENSFKGKFRAWNSVEQNSLTFCRRRSSSQLFCLAFEQEFSAQRRKKEIVLTTQVWPILVQWGREWKEILWMPLESFFILPQFWEGLQIEQGDFYKLFKE